MNIEIKNVPLQEEYDKFKKLCPNAKEKFYPDGSRTLFVEYNGQVLFQLDYIKKGQLSERDVFVVKNWGLNPNNAKEIIEAYNTFVPDKIDLSKVAEQEMSYYKVMGKGNDYTKGFINELKRLNPGVEISGKWIKKRNYTLEQLTIITSKPIEQLNQPTGYYGNALGRIMFLETYEEFTQSMNGNFLHYNVSERLANEFVRELRTFNPNIEISMTYDRNENVGRITSSVPLDKLNYPIGYYGGIGLDKDGNIAYLHDRIIDYKLDSNNNQYVEETQKYFGFVTINKEQERTAQDSQQSNQEYVPHFDSSQEIDMQKTSQLVKSDSQDDSKRMTRGKRKFTIIQKEKAMNNVQKAKNHSAIMAGICILGAAVAVYFNGQDVNQVLQHELNAIYSWKAFGQYLQDLGPLTTLLSVGAGGFIAKYLKNSRKLKQAQNEFVEFNNYLENEQTFGGNGNDRTR